MSFELINPSRVEIGGVDVTNSVTMIRVDHDPPMPDTGLILVKGMLAPRAVRWAHDPPDTGWLPAAARPVAPAHPAHALGVRAQARKGTLVSDEQITMPKLTAQILFDAAVGSMDFSSGMLDTEEVEALRWLAVALGVDPAEATPHEFRSNYVHPFEPMPDEIITRAYTPYVAVNVPGEGWVTERQGERPESIPCQLGAWGRPCGKPEDDPIHQVGA